MENNTKNMCRCCLKSMHSANVGEINRVTREMLSLLLLKLDLDVSEHPLVCGTCSEVLDEIYLFKSKCLYTEDIISAHVETNSKVSLRDILIELENKRNIHIGEDEVVCRLCIETPLNGSYIALGETGDGISLIRDMMQIHLPEMDLSISEKPIICDVCHVQLKKYVSFATNCMAVEEKIKLYCDLQKISGPVDLARVLQFIEDKALDNRLKKDMVIKQEDDSLMVNVEQVQDAEDYILEYHLVNNSRTSELCLKNEEIEIKSENDEMSEEIEVPVQTVAPNNSEKSSSLNRKKEIRKSPSKGGRHFSSDDNTAEYRGRRKMLGCRECRFKTDRKYILARHMVRHKYKSDIEWHKCVNCEFETRIKGNIIRHMRTHGVASARRKFKCDQCPFETDSKSSIREHNLIHKGKSEGRLHKCQKCDYMTKNKGHLNQHILVKHRDPRAERKFKCDQCPYETDLKSCLRSHNLMHKDISEVEMHKCQNCEYMTRHKGHLNQHMTVKHRDPRAEKKFKCDKCPFDTDYKRTMRNHNLKQHNDKSEVGMYKCAHCEYESNRKGSLILHLQFHRVPSADRKFKCDQCPFETDFKASLTNHNLAHKGKSEVEMYKCVNCEFETRHKGHMIRHMLAS